MSVHIPNTKQSTVGNFPQQQRLTTKGFCRVTKHRRCRVCGKPDWCGYSADEQTSICMRESNGSKGTSRNGGNIYHHGRLCLVSSSRFNRKPTPLPIKIAPIEIRNAVYEELIRRSPAVKYYSQLIDGPHGLLVRGLDESKLQNYGALPRTQKERSSLARALNKFVTVRFPENALQNSRGGVIGVPGFWQDESGIVQLWKGRDYNLPLLVIPYRDDQGRIQACQLRVHRNDISFGEKKYRWLGGALESRGTSSGTPIHFTFASEALPPGETVVVTEGALKAEALVSLRPKARVIATGGVNCSHASELLLPIAEVQPIVQARLASIETAEFLGSKYRTSLTAALLKSSDVANERCCVVVSRDEIIEWAKPNELFKHFIGRRERLNDASLAPKLMAGGIEERVSGLVPAEVWLDESNLRPGAMIYEDSVFQAHYNSVLTLLTINEPLTDIGVDDEESLLDELDPDEFSLHRRRWPGRK